MSRYRIPDKAFSDRRLKSRELRILMALEEHADGKGYCWPSQGRLGELTGMDRTQVCKGVKVLRESGYLVQAGRKHRACNYYLTLPAETEAPPPSNRSKKGTQSCANGGTQTPQGTIPPCSPPHAGGDIAASPDGDKSPVRRRKRRQRRGGGRTAATPPPNPRPSDRGGGAMLPADIEGATKALARQAGQSTKCATRAPPLSPCQRAMTHADVMTRDMAMRLWKRAGELNDEAAACEEFGFTKFGYWKGKDR